MVCALGVPGPFGWPLHVYRRCGGSPAHPTPDAPMLADARPAARAIGADTDAGRGRRHRSLRRLPPANL